MKCQGLKRNKKGALEDGLIVTEYMMPCLESGIAKFVQPDILFKIGGADERAKISKYRMGLC
jgi:hypothetical protein